MTILYLLAFFVAVGPSTGQTAYNLITRNFETIYNSSIATTYFTETQRPLMECLLMCENDINCHSLQFNNVTKYCWRSADNVIDNPSAVLPTNTDYRLYYKVPRCPDGWEWFHYRCYKFIDTSMTWNDSMTNCEELGGWLALPRDMNHVAFFNNITTCTPGPSTCFPWIGMHDLQTEGYIQGLEGFTIPTSVLSVTVDNIAEWDCAYIDPDVDNEVFIYDCMDIATSICERLE